MTELLTQLWANDFYRRVLLSGIVLLVILVTRRTLRFLLLSRLPDDSPHLHTIRSITNYALTFLGLVLLLGVWIQRVGDLSVAFGILGAGLAFALQEVIGSIAGWITIVTGQPFNVGDRIETGGIRGDVIDISMLRTKLMETGNWLGGDHNTGRIVTVSNAFIFKEPLFNYSKHLDYIWDELTLPITYDSDWRRAAEIMASATKDHPNFQELLPKAQEQRRRARREFAIKVTSLDPRVFFRPTDNWIELGLIYPVQIELRRLFRSQLSQTVLTQFKEENIRIASQTIAIVQFPEQNA